MVQLVNLRQPYIGHLSPIYRLPLIVTYISVFVLMSLCRDSFFKWDPLYQLDYPSLGYRTSFNTGFRFLLRMTINKNIQGKDYSRPYILRKAFG